MDNGLLHNKFMVKHHRELAALYPDEIVDFSCDNKAKVYVGTLAVSRYHQITKFHLLNYALNYDDHDFPSSTKLASSVYLEIKYYRSNLI
ncbi:unnamed protein product [Didymodactylos carnosus]|uniref:Uncharacterized protein n=1 Tax=Didymodactylos carnosus TaxID=1234261 RepID=A0A8S2FUT4_9BILA|nr:unnamed protein product [Didymodactylos carnosus]CAF4358404.1 unnamed protein product [Didymodactylos carnosus]